MNANKIKNRKKKFARSKPISFHVVSCVRFFLLCEVNNTKWITSYIFHRFEKNLFQESKKRKSLFENKNISERKVVKISFVCFVYISTTVRATILD